MVLKKEVMKTQSRELEKAAEYRHLLVHAIHACAAKFPDVAASVSALDVVFFVREIMVRRFFLCPPPRALHGGPLLGIPCARCPGMRH